MTVYLVLATGNLGKAKEVRALLPNVTVQTLADHPSIVMPPEDGETFEANAALKAEHVCRILGQAVLADDSGLVVDALGGAPGVRSARYCEGSDADRYRFLLKNLEGVPEAQRTARFVCAMAFARPVAETIVTQGACEGAIGFAPVGDGGFGYDPVFMRPEGRSMAELAAAEKNEVSHRAKALAAMRPTLNAHFSLELGSSDGSPSRAQDADR